MLKGKFELRELVGGKSFVGSVSVEIILDEGSKEVQFAGGCFVGSLEDEKRWRIAIEFGIEYAIDRLPFALRNRIGIVRVTFVDGYLYDTTMPVLAYVATMAFFLALEFEPVASIDFEGAFVRFAR